MLVVLVVSIGFSGHRLAGERDLTGYFHTDFMTEFQRAYESKDEEHFRAKVFEDTLARIQEHNSNPAKTWYATVNEFSDWTAEEFRSLHSGVKSIPKSIPGASTSTREQTRSIGRGIPLSIDWRDHEGVLTAVKDQGGCGSCWAFSAVETFESRLALSTAQPAPVLSEQQLVSCSPDPKHCGGSGGCGGSTQLLAFNYTMTAGLAMETAYPYQGVTGSCDKTKLRPVAINTGFASLPANNYTALLEAVVDGPVAVSVAAGSLGWQLYGGGVFDGGLFGCGYDIDHGVQLVGFDSDADEDYWIVRNSWGPKWGEGGFIRIKRFGEGKEPCGMDKKPQDGDGCKGDVTPVKYCGMCGILSSSSFPTGVHLIPS